MQPRKIIFLSFCLLLFACKEEKPVCDVTGKWFFNTVIRNDRITNTLQDGYFEFKPDQTFSSNLFDESQKLNYTLNNGIIKINTEEEFSLEIKLCSPDTLLLVGPMSLFDMQFLLTKVKKVDSLDLRSINPLGVPEAEDDQLY